MHRGIAVCQQADAQIIAARRYDAFWNTGNEALAYSFGQTIISAAE